MRIHKLSIIMPAYNEEKTVVKTIRKVLQVKIQNINKELIIVNDGSIDNTLKALKSVKDKRIILISKRENKGKGAAVRDALKRATGEVIIIQDADLEYNPREIVKLIDPIKKGVADVVYGSRFMGGEAHRVHFFWHMVGNKFLTLITNMVTNINFSDMETCYKMFTKDIAKKLDLKEDRFGFEPEFTIKVAKMKARIYEMGISYSGRNYAEGKKINWKDGVRALWVMVKYGVLE